MSPEIFNDYRPYIDSEINPAMKRIVESEHFANIAFYIFPEKSIEEVKSLLFSFNSIYQFQVGVMKAFNEQVIKTSISHFSFEGLDKLDINNRFLFVSNHRDIVLDSALLQYALYLSNHQTSEISFGSNLMVNQLAIDFGKSNKMFKLIRGGNIKDFYTNSLHLSQYINYTIKQRRESIWIAQRNGRTKDGIDLTDQGIIKIFYMSSSENPAKTIAGLNLVPISVSYEWEPCDFLKALELYHSRFGKYEKKPGEDVNSILTGIRQPKGKVHFHAGSPLTESEMEPFKDMPHNKFNRNVASLVDNQIIANYKLSCNNYIAHDLRSGSDTYKSHYTAEEKDLFMKHYHKLDSFDVEDKSALSGIFLGIYANPVDAKASLQ